ncbi:MAG: preprotein translocase subunit YajC [Neisseriaceae bacterium]|nr:preprotein translocase subunit YajC [Neisseriaceae bacterium]
MISIAYAADAAQAGASSGLASFLPLILILVVFWFLVMRPQQQKYKKHQEMIGELKRGDKVILNSGFLGRITKVDERFFTVEIADNVEVKVEKMAIADRYDPNATVDTPETVAKKADKKEEKK